MINKPFSSNSADKSHRWWAEPFFWGFVIIFGAATAGSGIYSSEWYSSLLLASSVAAASLLVILTTRKRALPALEIPRPPAEVLAALGWYTCLVLASLLSRNSAVLGNEINKWLWFVVLPIILLWIISRRERGFKDALRSVGLHRRGTGKSLLWALAAFAVLLFPILLLMPPEQLDKITDIFSDPLEAAIATILGFLMMLLTAGFTEEFFFRGILQSRLAKALKSEMRACLMAAFLFGLYHLPYAYFSADWTTHGNWGWSIATVLTEQMIAGVILGVLWARTRNLAASAFLHALINTLAILSSMNFNISFG